MSDDIITLRDNRICAYVFLHFKNISFLGNSLVAQWLGGFLGAQLVKNPPAVQETQV